MKDSKGGDGIEEKQEWKTGRQGERKEKQGWTKEEVGMTSGKMGGCVNVNVRERKPVDQKGICETRIKVKTT
jgi:hypothetical protein